MHEKRDRGCCDVFEMTKPLQRSSLVAASTQHQTQTSDLRRLVDIVSDDCTRRDDAEGMRQAYLRFSSNFALHIGVVARQPRWGREKMVPD